MQSVSKLVIIINFEVNRNYIAKNLCEKKEEENNCCKGSCHLKKQLAEDDKKDEATNTGKIKFEKEEYPDSFVRMNLFRNKKEDLNTLLVTPLSEGVKQQLLRPPGNHDHLV